MIPTIEYIERKFKEYNELMFEGKLKPLPFKLSSARTFLGKISCIRKKQEDGTWFYSDFVFIISNKTDYAEDVVEDTIIHEMIHYWIFSNQMQDTGPHGKLFVAKMREINRKYNRNLSVVHKNTKEELDKDLEIRQHLICISRFRGNQLGITIANKSKLFMLWDELPKVPKVVECNWYVSTDPFFNRYPRASSIKIYSISRADLEAHHGDFKRLVRNGDTISVSKG